MGKISLKEAKEINLVEYLSSLGFQPVKVRNNDYWYLSPLRNEHTASFKVNSKLNRWYDHGLGKGGDLITFGTLYFNCSISELLEKLSSETVQSFSFHQQQERLASVSSADENQHQDESKIEIIASRPLFAAALLKYVDQRCIPREVAQLYCQEVDFRLNNSQFTAIGFRNDSGGYELRNASFKGSSSPKTTTLLQEQNREQLAVFEGFFDFLSFTSSQNDEALLSDCLILNSLAFLEKSRPLMEQHGQVYLLLDRDEAGISATKKALEWNTGQPNKYIDRSDFYEGHKDLNEWLVAQKGAIRKQPQQKLKFRRSFRS